MKLVKRLTAAVVALAVAAPCAAFAANVVYYDAENAQVTYSYDTAKGEVSAVAYYVDDSSKIVYVNQVSGDGEAVVGTFTMPDSQAAAPSGKYVIDVLGTDGNPVAYKDAEVTDYPNDPNDDPDVADVPIDFVTFWHINADDPATVAGIAAVTGVTDPAVLATNIRANATGLAVDTSDDIEGISNYLVKFDISTAKKFAKNYAYAKLLDTLGGKSETFVTTELTKFENAGLFCDVEDSSKIKETIVEFTEAYPAYPQAVRTEVAGKLAGALALLTEGKIDAPDFKDEVIEWIAVARLNDAQTETAVKEILFESGYDFGLNPTDVTTYNASGYQADIRNDMIGYNFTNKESVATAFHTETTKSRGNGGNGGGGGGGGGSYPDEDEDDNGDGGNVVIPPNPSEIKGRYLDDVGGHWAESMINDLHSKGIVNGSDNKFYPNNNITRAEFCTLIAQAFYKNKTGSTASFGDVTPDDWYYSYVGLLNAKGIVSGMGDGTFGASRNITRQDMAAIIARCMNDLGKSTEATREMAEFTDAAEIASYSVDAIKMLYTANIISGYEDGSFNPTANLTKAEAATVIFKLLNK